MRNLSIIKYNGNYKDQKKTGIWKYYYPNGKLRKYEYYNPDSDSLNLYYKKVYNISGKLDSVLYPIKFITNSKEDYIVGEKYQLSITLDYSEFDSLLVAAFIGHNKMANEFTDTLLYEGSTILFDFVPKIEGQNFIHGILFELDATKGESDDAYGGQRYFKFDYKAVR